MPNWCWNKVRIVGSKSRIDELVSLMNGENCFDFNKVAPYPEHFKARDEASGDAHEGFNNGGFNWCNWNWGTMWNSWEPSMVRRKDGRVVTYSYDTAWSASLPLTSALSTLFPELKFTHSWREDDNDDKGKQKFWNGGEDWEGDEDGDE